MLETRAWAITAAGCLGCFATMHAEVVWDSRSVSLVARPDDESMTFAFPFRVEGKGMAFLPTEIPCGCADASPDKNRYRPGDRGVYSIRLALEDRVGDQEIEVPIHLDDGERRDDGVLTLRAAIPQLIQAQRKVVVWDAKSGPGPQRLTFTVSEPYAVTSAQAVSGHESVAATISAISDQKTLTVEFAIKSPGYHKPVKVEIATDLPVKRQAKLTVWAVNRLPE